MTPSDPPPPDGFDVAPLARDVLGSESEDVAQDVWLLLRRQPPEHVRNLGGWLRLAIVHAARRSKQRDRRRAERERIVARPDRAPSVLEELELKHLREQLTELVNELREPYREVVRLRYLEDCEVEEVAARVGRTPGTVRSQLTRGLDLLRARMGVQPRKRRALPALFFGWWRDTWERADPRTRRRIAASSALVTGLAAGVWVIATLYDRPEPESRELLASAVDTAEPAASAPLDAGRGAPPLREPIEGLPVETAVRPAEEEWTVGLEGDVLDSDGTPVPDAEVMVGAEKGIGRRVATRSDAVGHYRVESVDSRLLIWATAKGHAPTNRHLIASKDPERELDLRLGNRIGTLGGRVLSFDGQPVSGADVLLYTSSARTESFDSSELDTLAYPQLAVRAVTEDDGGFQLGSPGQERFWLLVTADGHPPRMFAPPPDHDLGKLEIRLQAPCTLEGILRRRDGTLASRARLALVLAEPLPARETETDETGRFLFAALPPVQYALRLLEDPGDPSTSCSITGVLREGEAISQDAILDNGLPIRGRALDGDRPLADALVRLQESASDSLPGVERTAETDPDGNFSFANCVVGRRYRLQLVGTDGEGASDETIVRANPEQEEVLLRVRDSGVEKGSLSGRFESAVPSHMPVLVSLRRDSTLRSILLKVDRATGAFAADDLSPDGYKLRAWIPGMGLWPVGKIEILPGQREEIQQTVPAPAAVEVRVEVPEKSSSDKLEVLLWSGAFGDGGTGGGCRRLRETAPYVFTTEALPCNAFLEVSLGGTVYESHRGVRLDAGQALRETIDLRKGVPKTLRIVAARNLREGEKATLTIRGASGERKMLFAAAALKNNRSMQVRVFVPSDARELHIDTSSGLSGKLAITESDLVQEEALKLKLEASAQR